MLLQHDTRPNIVNDIPVLEMLNPSLDFTVTHHSGVDTVGRLDNRARENPIKHLTSPFRSFPSPATALASIRFLFTTLASAFFLPY